VPSLSNLTMRNSCAAEKKFRSLLATDGGLLIDSCSPDLSVASPCDQCSLSTGVPARSVADCGLDV
jgi:hypothetical protein